MILFTTVDNDKYQACVVNRYHHNIIITLLLLHIEGWERKSSNFFFTYIHLDLFRFHPSISYPAATKSFCAIHPGSID